MSKILIAICISLIIGMLIGRFLDGEESCPRNVMNYDCKGPTCDHTKSELYRAKMHMAIADEQRKDNDRNFWSGGDV